MTTDHLRFERTGDVLDIVLDRADKGNIISGAMGSAIIAALQALDPAIKVVRLKANGPDFCIGRESPMPPKDAKPNADGLRRIVTLPPLALYDAMKAVPVPVIAVVRGRALGVGCALAGVCDVVLCADDAQFSVPEMERDIPPLLVMSALTGRVPIKTIAHLVLSREQIDAQAALRAGLVSKVVPADQLDTEAQKLADTLTGCSTPTLRAVKQFMQAAPEMTQQGASAFAANLAAVGLSAKF